MLLINCSNLQHENISDYILGVEWFWIWNCQPRHGKWYKHYKGYLGYKMEWYEQGVSRWLLIRLWFLYLCWIGHQLHLFVLSCQDETTMKIYTVYNIGNRLKKCFALYSFVETMKLWRNRKPASWKRVLDFKLGHSLVLKSSSPFL